MMLYFENLDQVKEFIKNRIDFMLLDLAESNYSVARKIEEKDDMIIITIKIIKKKLIR